jgi:hypothetical protein
VPPAQLKAVFEDRSGEQPEQERIGKAANNKKCMKPLRQIDPEARKLLPLGCLRRLRLSLKFSRGTARKFDPALRFRASGKPG